MIHDAPTRAMRPAPHVRVDGSVGPPIGTFEEQLARAYAPRPKPYGYTWRQQFIITLDDCAQFLRDISTRVAADIQRQEDGQ